VKTYDGYVRVSQRRGRKGASFISPELQREAIAPASRQAQRQLRA
jgi:hypothetical protein